MPDMQSALLRALEDGKRKFLHTTIDAWDTHEQTIRSPQPQAQPEEKTVQTIIKTGNLSRDIFNHIKNGEFTRDEVAESMASVGYVKKSAQSLIAQMLRNGLLTDKNERLYPLLPEYAPVANPTRPSPVRTYNRRKPRTSKAKTKETPKAAQAPAGLAALPTTKEEPKTLMPTPNPARLVRMQTADEVLSNLSVAEAHKLYVALGKMFGGVK